MYASSSRSVERCHPVASAGVPASGCAGNFSVKQVGALSDWFCVGTPVAVKTD